MGLALIGSERSDRRLLTHADGARESERRERIHCVVAASDLKFRLGQIENLHFHFVHRGEPESLRGVSRHLEPEFSGPGGLRGAERSQKRRVFQSFLRPLKR